MHNILLIGAGQLGSRHLQGLMKCNLPVRIEVVEPDEQNRNTAVERAKQVKGSGNVAELAFRNAIDEILFSEADLAIIATNSDVRADVIVQLTSRVNVRHIILEKVVYQSLEIFDQQICLMEAQGIKAWVNHPRRIYPFYKNLKNELPPDEKISLTISGSNWGLGCNSLHFIDLFSYLTGNNECKTDFALLDPEILQSKRPGFVEFSGRIGFSNSGGCLHLASYNFPGVPVFIEVACAGRRWIIDEAQGNVVYFSENRTKMPETNVNRFPFQSELTNLVAEDVISTGDCGLTSLKESFYQHSLLLPLLNNQLFAIRGVMPGNCPIT